RSIASAQASARASTAGARAAAVANKLSDTDLVGQVLVPELYGESATSVSASAAKANRKIAGVDTPAQIIAKFRLGGVILANLASGDPTALTNKTTNIASASQVRSLDAGLQKAAAALPAKAPLLIGTDQEYGVVTRLRSGVVQLPSAMAFGAAHDPKLTQAAWAAAGHDLAGVGLNVDFAPDADVVADAGNTVIGSRSFGGTASAVASQVGAAVNGLHSAGIGTAIKHFPGHGDTDTDSHTSLPVLHQSLAQLTSVDLAPFKAGIAAGTDMVMVGHLDVTAVDPGIPATFSPKVVTGLLRDQLGFKGVVITDAMNMEPAMRWAPGEAAVRAVLAGDDMLLMPPDLAAAQSGLLAALHSGRLPRAQLVASVTRILTLKFGLAVGSGGGAGSGASGGATDGTQLDSPAARATAAKVAAAAVTVLSGACHGPLASGPVSVASPSGYRSTAGVLADALRADGVDVVTSGGTEVDIVGYGDGVSHLDPDAAITVAVDTPYVLRYAKSPVRLATYSATAASMTALAAVIAGRAAAPGSSPVPVTGLPRSACAPAG
ncbi:MAG TPA: glycoside hydrolase family 3 N-terminal domain-containing protein, partial [Micromonosporaceae bacterium]